MDKELRGEILEEAEKWGMTVEDFEDDLREFFECVEDKMSTMPLEEAVKSCLKEMEYILD